MSLDIAYKTKFELQEIIRKQSLQLTELQAQYEDVQRQLQATLDSYSVAQSHVAALNGELEEVRSNLDSAVRAKRTVEMQYEEAQTRINELSTINAKEMSIKGERNQKPQGRMSVDRVRRFQSQLEAAVDNLDNAENNLKVIREKHRLLSNKEKNHSCILS